jgi:hypothetical protein
LQDPRERDIFTHCSPKRRKLLVFRAFSGIALNAAHLDAIALIIYGPGDRHIDPRAPVGYTFLLAVKARAPFIGAK